MTAVVEETPLRCNNGCSVTIYDGQQPIAPGHMPMVQEALKKRLNARNDVFSSFGGTQNNPRLEVGYAKDGRFTFHMGEASGLNEQSHGPWVLVAVLEYTCPCGPSASLDWLRKEGDGNGGYLWRLDPHQNDKARYIGYINEITVTGRNGKGKCFMALTDTPTVSDGEWMAYGRVEWAEDGPKKCSDQAQFKRIDTVKGKSRKMPHSDRIKGLPGLREEGRLIGGGDP